MNRYKDIISLGRPKPIMPPMSMENRAAQFAAFAALTGYEDAIEETARLTSGMIERSADELYRLSEKFGYYMSLGEKPPVDITLFQPDGQKKGGRYITLRQAVIKKVDKAYGVIILNDNREIPMDYIYDISVDLEE